MKLIRDYTGMCLLGYNSNSTVCEGDEGGPAIKERDGVSYLAGIAINDLPKNNQGLNGMRYFCGPETSAEGKAVPGKFVKIFQKGYLSWLIKDHSQAGIPVRPEIEECLADRGIDLDRVLDWLFNFE